jgi:hypothetical protein
MPLSLHEASVAVMAHMLGQLSAILDKAAAYAEAGGIDPATLVEARLAPDMFALARQVQIARTPRNTRSGGSGQPGGQGWDVMGSGGRG